MSFAVYLRVSTDKQTTENQEPTVRALVEAREPSYELSAWLRAAAEGRIYRETMSAAKDRPVFEHMMEDARLGKFRRLYVWSLDRFGRSMFANLRDLATLADRWNVAVVSVRESWVEQTADPMLKKLLLAIFSWVAEHERERLRQRTRAGVERARAAGKALGRPRASIPDRAISKAADLRAASGDGWRDIARELKRLGFGEWNHATLARECTKRVSGVRRGKPGWGRG